jgi:subtilisin-like proprotein convertase family protein
MKKSLIFLTICTLVIFTASSQEISIASTDSYTSCEGAVVDSGLSAADYGANENQTITWCPEAPETVLNLYWVVFDLDAASTIYIYDGDDNTAPLVGTYSGDELQGQDIFSGEENVTGCMTIEFTSGPGSSGNFGAYASCGYPCDRPFAIVNPTELQPHYACLNEEVHLEATSSTVADGQEIVEWVWDLGDGTIDNTSGQILTHTYTSPGLYTMNLSLTDDNDCSNNNLLDYQILVSTNPDFTGTSSNVTMCVGDEVDLTGMIQGVLYNAEPSVDFGDGLFIPDDQSQCFYSQLTFTSFNAGAVVNDANVDIQNIFMNFEHSFMGDLTITFICPNGGSILVHQQGGSGTFLGEPVDDDLDPDNPGIGYDYWWEPGATNGTWADNIQGTLPSGVYESVQPFTNLNGCPLNGTWEVEVCDLWGQDNGFIFDWSIEFAPELYPEAVSFTPTFGPECDSTWWDGPSIIDDGGDCNIVTISPNEIGVESYIYRGQNDFGCYYDRTIDVTVVGTIPTVTANQTQFCGSPVQMMANIGDVDPEDCEFSWTPSTNLDDSSSQSPTIDFIENTTEYTVSVSYSTSGLTCVSDASIRIETCEITIPNVFSPDNLSTGGNNTWRVEGLDAFNGVKCFIYNRWGTEVYSHIDFGSSAGWDPGIDGAEEGVYYYVLEIPCNEGDELITDQAGVITEFDCNGMVPFTGTIALYRVN